MCAKNLKIKVKQIKMDEELLDNINLLAQLKCTSKQDIISQALATYIDKNLKKKNPYSCILKKINKEDLNNMFIPVESYAKYNNITTALAHKNISNGKLKSLQLADTTFVATSIAKEIQSPTSMYQYDFEKR